MNRYSNKVAVVTGGASGIGLATVERLAAEGAQVLCADIQDEKGAALEARFPGRVAYRRCDVLIEEEIVAALDEASTLFGGLDLLFNNAGAAGAPIGLEDLDADSFRRMIDLLLTSVVSGTRHGARLLKARGGGAIVNTASVAGLQAGYGPLAYSTAKAGVIHFTRCAAADLAPHAVRINAICPGLIATSIIGDALGLPRPVADQMAALLAERGATFQPLARAGLPEDVAGLVAFLGSDEARFITGAHFLVDGGLTIGPRSAWDTQAEHPVATMLGVGPDQAAALRRRPS